MPRIPFSNLTRDARVDVLPRYLRETYGLLRHDPDPEGLEREIHSSLDFLDFRPRGSLLRPNFSGTFLLYVFNIPNYKGKLVSVSSFTLFSLKQN